MKRYRVVFKRKVERGLKKLPKEVRKLLFLLLED
jgi:mRNA-degrading endonuclease RelE of RelBE toxin-antitoxin system